MDYPMLSGMPSEVQTTEAFGGYNHNLRIGDGEFYDMENLSSDRFPVLSLRKKRGLAFSCADEITGMIAKDSLCYTAGSKFYINGHGVEMGLNEQKKQLVSMGAYVIILPDKKWINTMDTTQLGNIENSFTGQNVSFTLCKQDGASQSIDYTGDTEPTEPENMQIWLDTSTTPHGLKQYSASAAKWTTIPTTYVKVYCAGIGAGFSQYDGIDISGLAESEYDDLKALNGSAIVWDKGDDYLVIVGIIDAARTVTTPITFQRTMPEMDFITESNNRLWGCRYGLAENGDVVNEIYACKLGDFKNWKCFMGISTDSYAVSLGSDGVFTGAVTHQGYPLFFKENCLHKIYGQIPANFQVQTTSCRGVQKGSAESLCVVNEVLYYLSNNGVCAYDGSIPVEVSSVFGVESYHAGIGAAFNRKYYMRCQNSEDEAAIFVYDTAKNMWHKESDEGFTGLCGCRDDVYACTETTIYSLNGSYGEKEGQISWFAESGIIGAVSPNMKYLARMNIRLSMDAGSEITISVEYDSSGTWEELGTFETNILRSFYLPVHVRRCDHLRIRMEGTGGASIFAITKTIEQGSDISW